MKTDAKSPFVIYALTVLGVICISVISVMIFTLRVDPYLLFPKYSGASHQRSIDLFYHLRLHKPYAMERIKPTFLVAGSSRSAGLAPLEGDLIELGGYNVSLPGASMREVRRIIEHANEIAPLSQLIIGLDYYMFDPLLEDSDPLIVEDRFLSSDMSFIAKMKHWRQRFEDYWASIFSVDAVIDSLRTNIQTRTSKQLYREDGTWDVKGGAVSPMWLYSQLAKQIFEEMSAAQVRDYEELQLLFEFLREKRIHTKIFITPFNGLLLETIVRANSWDNYIAWQRRLIEMVDAYEPMLSIYGLETSAELVLEKVDSASPSFKDGVHLTREASQQVFECLNSQCSLDSEPVHLTPGNMNRYFAKMIHLRDQYSAENPTYTKKLTRWLSQ